MLNNQKISGIGLGYAPGPSLLWVPGRTDPGSLFMEKPRLITDLGMRYETSNSKLPTRYGLFQCPYCPKQFESRIAGIDNGHTKSCGCYTLIFRSVNACKHGGTGTDLYRVWSTAKQRCRNPKNKEYRNYGGRKENPITFPNDWDDFSVFKEWAFANGYKKGLQINRVNNDGNYGPCNCNFIPRIDNLHNKRLLSIRNKSGYAGVSYRKDTNKWEAAIMSFGKRYRLGSYSTPEIAAQTINDWIIKNNDWHPLNIIIKK